MPNSKHLTHGISNLMSLITKTKLGFQPEAPVIPPKFPMSVQRLLHFANSKFRVEML
jgi:hypothetical protein